MIFYIVLILAVSLGIDYFVNHKNSIITNVKDSFHNNPTGFSARKLSAFASFSIAAYVAVQNSTPEDAVMLAGVFLLYSLLCLGIVTAEQIVRFREGNKSESQKNNSPQTPPIN